MDATTTTSTTNAADAAGDTTTAAATNNNVQPPPPPPPPPPPLEQTPAELLPFINDPRYRIETTVVVVAPTDTCTSPGTSSSHSSSPSTSSSNSSSSSECSQPGADDNSSSVEEGDAQRTPVESRLRQESLHRFKAIIMSLQTGQSGLFGDRMALILGAWRESAVLLERTSNEAAERVMRETIRETLQLMLSGQWHMSVYDSDRRQLRAQIDVCMQLVQRCATLVHRCRYLLDNMDDPWGHPTLERLMGMRAADGDDTATADLQFLANERSCMITLRLQKLIETRLYGPACALATNALRYIRAAPAQHVLHFSTSAEQLGYMDDMRLLLLFRLRRCDEMLATVRRWTLAEAAAFCARNPPQQRGQLIERLRPHYEHVLDAVLPVFLTRFMSAGCATAASESHLQAVCLKWTQRNAGRATFGAEWRHLVAMGGGPRHFYMLLGVLGACFAAATERAGEKLEMLCRGMTHELNELEHMKTDAAVDGWRILQAERAIAPRYRDLATAFADEPALARELLLTSFSLHPREAAFADVERIGEQQMLEAGAVDGSGGRLTTLDDVVAECPAHRAEYRAERQQVKAFIACTRCGKRCVVERRSGGASEASEAAALAFRQRVGALHAVSGVRFVANGDYDALAAPNLILDAIERRADLSEERRMDLLTLISAPRIKSLSWLIEWPELRRNCLELLSEPAKMQRVEHSVARANERLAFLRPDYERYRHLRPHEYPGIETGYEVFYRDPEEATEEAHEEAAEKQQRTKTKIASAAAAAAAAAAALANGTTGAPTAAATAAALAAGEETDSAPETESAMAELRCRVRRKAQLQASKRRRYALQERRDAAVVAERAGINHFKLVDDVAATKRRGTNGAAAARQPRPKKTTTLVEASDGMGGTTQTTTRPPVRRPRTRRPIDAPPKPRGRPKTKGVVADSPTAMDLSVPAPSPLAAIGEAIAAAAAVDPVSAPVAVVPVDLNAEWQRDDRSHCAAAEAPMDYTASNLTKTQYASSCPAEAAQFFRLNPVVGRDESDDAAAAAGAVLPPFSHHFRGNNSTAIAESVVQSPTPNSPPGTIVYLAARSPPRLEYNHGRLPKALTTTPTTRMTHIHADALPPTTPTNTSSGHLFKSPTTQLLNSVQSSLAQLLFAHNTTADGAASRTPKVTLNFAPIAAPQPAVNLISIVPIVPAERAPIVPTIANPSTPAPTSSSNGNADFTPIVQDLTQHHRLTSVAESPESVPHEIETADVKLLPPMEASPTDDDDSNVEPMPVGVAAPSSIRCDQRPSTPLSVHNEVPAAVQPRPIRDPEPVESPPTAALQQQQHNEVPAAVQPRPFRDPEPVESPPTAALQQQQQNEVPAAVQPRPCRDPEPVESPPATALQQQQHNEVPAAVQPRPFRDPEPVESPPAAAASLLNGAANVQRPDSAPMQTEAQQIVASTDMRHLPTRQYFGPNETASINISAASVRRFSDTEIEMRQQQQQQPTTVDILAPSPSLCSSPTAQLAAATPRPRRSAQIFVSRRLRTELNACRVRVERLKPELIAWWTRSGPFAVVENNRLLQQPVVHVARLSEQQVAAEQRKRKQQQQQQRLTQSTKRPAMETPQRPKRRKTIDVTTMAPDDDDAAATTTTKATRKRSAVLLAEEEVMPMMHATNEVVLEEDDDENEITTGADADSDEDDVVFCGIAPEMDPLFLGNVSDPDWVGADDSESDFSAPEARKRTKLVRTGHLATHLANAATPQRVRQACNAHADTANEDDNNDDDNDDKDTDQVNGCGGSAGGAGQATTHLNGSNGATQTQTTTTTTTTTKGQQQQQQQQHETAAIALLHCTSVFVRMEHHRLLTPDRMHVKYWSPRIILPKITPADCASATSHHNKRSGASSRKRLHDAAARRGDNDAKQQQVMTYCWPRDRRPPSHFGDFLCK